jgi:hypothetical protein
MVAAKRQIEHQIIPSCSWTLTHAKISSYSWKKRYPTFSYDATLLEGVGTLLKSLCPYRGFAACSTKI